MADMTSPSSTTSSSTKKQPLLQSPPQQQQRRPFDILESNGNPQNPLPFAKPKVERGRRDTVLVCSNDKHQQCHDVLFREGRSLNLAYWSIPHKQPIKTIMGHVQICLVLKRSRSEASSDSEEGSENDDESDDDDDIVFSFTDQYVAIKVNYCARMEALRDKHAEDPMKEIAAMQWIGDEHRNVLGCKEVLFDGQNINVVLPFCRDGDLFELLQESQKLPVPGLSEERARFYFRQIMLGLQHLQRKGICHRDLSPENVMMDADGCVVIDMGMCLRIPYLDDRGALVDVTTGQRKLLLSPQGTCGKLPYMAPEIYANRTPFDGEAVDIWSCGTILFCMLSGNRSYARAHRSDPQFYWMTNGIEMLLKDWAVTLSPEAVDLLKGLLKADPRERLTLDEVLNHPWFR
jgi:serine/threonine protein kinase